MGDRDADPLERAVYLDPKMALAQWVAGRGRLARGEFEKAAYSLGEAHALCPDHQGFAADFARVELDRDKKRSATLVVDGLGAPDDPRLVPLRLDTWIARDRLADAGKLAQRANATFPKDARVAQVMAELSRANGDEEAYQSWLQQWADRDKTHAEPLRRLIQILARKEQWNDAWRALDQLEERGEAEEAKRWRVTVGLALGRYAEAAAAADPSIAARIRARASLEGAAGERLSLANDPSPEAHLARGRAHYQAGNAQRALGEADSALRKLPWWADALALRADALEALDKHQLATAARRQWRAAEPPEPQ